MTTSIAVLTSGGFDSAILAADLARTHAIVQPLFIRAGLQWEDVELQHLQRFLSEAKLPALRPAIVLAMPCTDLYQGHWSLTGQAVPDAASADEAVYLPGRNLLLLLKGMLWCHLHNVQLLAMGILKGNPFSDATPAFLRNYVAAVNQGIDGHVQLVTPFAQLSKREVLERGRDLPLHWTFSCIQPVDGMHCGACNKCAERQRAFAALGMVDPTPYAIGPSGP